MMNEYGIYWYRDSFSLKLRNIFTSSKKGLNHINTNIYKLFRFNIL